MRRMKIVKMNVENEARSMKMSETLFETLECVPALDTESAITKSSWASTGLIPVIESSSNPSTMSGMLTVLGYVLRLITSMHTTIATIIVRLALIFLVRVRGSLPRAGTASSHRSFTRYLCCSHGRLVVTNYSSAHVQLSHNTGGVEISHVIVLNYDNPLGLIAGIPGTEEHRGPRWFRHGIIGFAHPLQGRLPFEESISELIFILLSHASYILVLIYL